MSPISDNLPTTDRAADHLAPASMRLIGNRPMPRPATTEVDSASGFDPRRILNGLKYHWFLFVVLGTLLAGGLGTAAWELLPAKYTTYSVLRVAATESVKLDARDNGGRSEFITYLKTQAMLIKNEYVLRAAMRDSKIGDSETLKKQEDPVKWLEENLVVEFSENSEIVKIMLTGENPQDLADIVNAIQAAYMKEVVGKDQLKTKDLIDKLVGVQKFVEDMLANQTKNVETGKKKPDDLPSAAAVAAPKIKVGMIDYARLTEDLHRMQAELEIAREEEKQSIDKMATASAIEVPAQDLDTLLSNDPKYRELTHAVDVAQRKADYLKVSTRDPESSPDYKNELTKLANAKDAVEDYKRRIKSEQGKFLQQGARRQAEQRLEQMKFASRALEFRVKSKQQEIASIELVKDSVPSKSAADINPDETKLFQTSQVYEQLLRKYGNLVVETQTPGRVSQVQLAAVPIKKEMKKQLFGTAFAGMMGFVLVGACITLYESKVMRVFGSRDLTSNPAINMIGLLPEISASEARVRGAESDPFMEAVDQVRVLLGRNFFGKRAQSILIASAEAGEGKTTLAGHLAVSMTKTDKKTIIVDGNLRQPGMHEHLGLPLGPGVCELLRSESALHEVVQRTAIANLSFLSAGVYDPQAQQAIGRDKMRRILDKLRQEYDTIIIDSHALTPVADTLLMGQHCDAIVMCARKHVSRKPVVEQAYQRICELGVPHTGLIFLGEAAQ